MRMLMLALCLTFMGCGGSGSDSDEDKETVFDPLVQNIDKAEQVEGMVMEHKNQMDQAIEDIDSSGADDEE